MIRSALIAILVSLFSAAFTPAAVAEDEVYTGRFSSTAVQGYDTVAYFTEGEPVKGSADFATEYRGATWRFSSQENLDLFLADPDAYAPQYGGYCAWAVAQDKTAKGDARHWHITDGKLYLNFNRNINEKWLADRDTFIEQADGNWPTVLE
ncbi:MAG: YHS domain-containing (seleno)protein [Pseudomonadota bacterium]